MKVLMVNTEYFRGGASRIAKTLYSALNITPEFQSFFAYGRGPKVDDEKTFRFAWQPEVYLHAFLTRTIGLQGYGSWLSTKRFVSFIRKQRSSLIHLHNIHGYYLNLRFVEYLAKLGIPVVWTLHDGWPMTGRCAYFFECDRWKTGCGHCPDLSRYPKTYLDTSAFMWRRKKAVFTQGWNPLIVCPSQWLADRVKESYLNKYRVETIPNGIDTETFSPRERIAGRERLEIPLEKRVILFVAADLNDERKGARYFFESLQHIKADNYMVLTLGKRLDLKGRLKKAAEIKQLGYIADRGLLSEIYSSADVFCISSLDDNFPTTVLESLACGTPIVGFEVGGIPEQVTEDCGILVPSGDAQGLGEAITKLLRDDKLREDMSRNCRARAVAEYSVEKFRDRYVELYNKVVEEGKR